MEQIELLDVGARAGAEIVRCLELESEPKI